MLKSLRIAALALLAALAFSACDPTTDGSQPTSSVYDGLPPSTSLTTPTAPASSTPFTPPPAPGCGVDVYNIPQSNYFIDQMKVGETCWTNPHSLWLNMDGAYLLHPRYSVALHAQDDSTMAITRTDTGYQVVLTPAEKANITPSDQPPYFGTAYGDFGWINVAVIVK